MIRKTINLRTGKDQGDLFSLEDLIRLAFGREIRTTFVQSRSIRMERK